MIKGDPYGIKVLKTIGFKYKSKTISSKSREIK